MDLELSLVRSGVITPQDYVEALWRRERERPSLGQVALEQGLLRARDVLHLMRQQYGRSDQLFSEHAVAQGYLSPRQLAEMQVEQQKRLRPVVEHLVELGRLTQLQADSFQRTFGAQPRIPPGVEEPD